MASFNIHWICGQFTHKNEGSDPGPCHFCQTPHPKRKAVVVSVPTSVSPAKPVCIGQPARYSGSAIDLSAPDMAQAVASAASLAKAVSICQPAPRYSGSIIEWHPRCRQSLCSFASQHCATPVLSLICGPLQMGRWLRHPRRQQSLCLGYPPVL